MGADLFGVRGVGSVLEVELVLLAGALELAELFEGRGEVEVCGREIGPQAESGKKDVI